MHCCGTYELNTENMIGTFVVFIRNSHNIYPSPAWKSASCSKNPAPRLCRSFERKPGRGILYVIYTHTHIYTRQPHQQRLRLRKPCAANVRGNGFGRAPKTEWPTARQQLACVKSVWRTDRRLRHASHPANPLSQYDIRILYVIRRKGSTYEQLYSSL